VLVLQWYETRRRGRRSEREGEREVLVQYR
jgi:hypothetical protein